MSGEEFSHKEPCPSCGSRDNLARYADGHAHCFSPHCDYWETAEGSRSQRGTTKRRHMAGQLLDRGEAVRLGKRKLTEETCKKWDYTVTKDEKGRSVQSANYRDSEGTWVAQHLRYPDKEMPWRGSVKKAGLFGQHLWRQGGRKLIITEGEIDAMTVSQIQNHKWPVVSIKSGSDGAAKDILQEIEFVESFNEVILMFDQDSAGQKAEQEVSEVLTPGKCKIARLPGNDPNELHQEGRGDEVIQAMWEAKPKRPESLKTASELRERAKQPPKWGEAWPWEPLTRFTYGRHRPSLVFIGAGTGIGKTDFMLETGEYNWRECGLPSGYIFLETPSEEVLQRLAGKHAGKPFHVPDGEWTTEERDKAIDELADSEAFVFFDHSGATTADWEGIKSKIKWMALGLGIKDIFLDHITALAAMEDDEKKALEQLTAEMGSMVHELGITLYVVSHLSTPDGTPHEEGGRVMIRHFKGSRAIGYWAHFMIGLERNTQSENTKEKETTTVRVLKDRLTGKGNGEKFYLRLNHETYRNELADPPPSVTGESQGTDHGFSDETSGGSDY